MYRINLGIYHTGVVIALCVRFITRMRGQDVVFLRTLASIDKRFHLSTLITVPSITAQHVHNTQQAHPFNNIYKYAMI